MPFVEATITVEAPPRVVYELAKEQERFPEFMPDVESVTVLERAGDRMVTRWKTLVEEAPIEWTEEDVFDDEALRVVYHLIEGDLDRFEGTWTFENGAPGCTHVTLGVEYDFGVPTLAELIGPTLHRKVRENTEMMLAALKREAESKAIEQPARESATAGTALTHRENAAPVTCNSTLLERATAMAKYVFVYKGGGGMAQTEEAQQAAMAAWGQWFGQLGAAVVDGGNPFGPSKSVSPAGKVTDGGPSGLSGYSIVNAGSLDAAAEMAKGCPVLASGGTVDVYETFDVM
jgi:ribosome-associated toxin RatA of RatAB toxin-antitoxin module